MNSSTEIKGFLIYREETEEEIKKKLEEEASIKELIKQNQGDNPALNNEVEDETQMLSEEVAAIIKKFKGKYLKDFVPHFLLKQFEDNQDDKIIIYDSFD